MQNNPFCLFYAKPPYSPQTNQLPSILLLWSFLILRLLGKLFCDQPSRNHIVL